MSMHRIWAEAVEAQLRLLALYGLLAPSSEPEHMSATPVEVIDDARPVAEEWLRAYA